MSIASFLEDGLTAMQPDDGQKIRYAVVGLGDIAQEAMLPGIKHTGNSELTALVTGDPEKARELGKMYGVELTLPYEQFDQLLASDEIDAIYLATPNWLHADFAVRALRAGIHVLLEKPMEMSVEKCQEIIEAQRSSGAKLMVAYRLHFEPATLDTIKKIREGELGEIRFFSSAFSQLVNPSNHRAKNGEKAGPLYDMGPYPINAARYLFGDEPTEVVSAAGVEHADMQTPGMADTVAVVLRFPGDRLAQFTVSYAANGYNSFVVAGTKGSIELGMAYTYGQPKQQLLRIGEKTTMNSFAPTDQFGGEMKYFSDCILKNLEVEPDGEEGLADVRVMVGIEEAMRTGRAVTLPPFTRHARINTDTQVQKLGTVTPPPRVNATSPSVN